MRGTAQGTLCGGQLVGLTGVAEDTPLRTRNKDWKMVVSSWTVNF